MFFLMQHGNTVGEMLGFSMDTTCSNKKQGGDRGVSRSFQGKCQLCEISTFLMLFGPSSHAFSAISVQSSARNSENTHKTKENQ